MKYMGWGDLLRSCVKSPLGSGWGPGVVATPKESPKTKVTPSRIKDLTEEEDE